MSKNSNLLELYPEIAAQWHPNKNGDLKPEDVSYGSNKKVWWQCNAGPDHEWMTSIANRTYHRTGCPYCANHKVSVTNRLSTNYPALAKEWHPDKNGTLSSGNLVYGSTEKVWWKCDKGSDHEWQATINARTTPKTEGSGCPFCSGNKVSELNSLASNFPEIVAQWHPSKNGDLKPEDVSYGSGKKVWWKCNQRTDHEWLAIISNRTVHNQGCPFCSGQRVSASNNLELVSPEIAAQWHPTKNGDLRPSDVTSGSSKIVWWKCAKNSSHEWEAGVGARTGRSGRIKRGCPYCSGRKVDSTNSLAALYPDLVKQWHPTKNGELAPSQVTARSQKKVWWICSLGADHEWQTTVDKRTTRGYNCPFCSNQRVSITNSLAAQFPEIAAQWHPTKNGELTPDQVVYGSYKKVWWKCPKVANHEWQTVPGERTKKENPTGCPVCARQKASVLIDISKSLAVTHPDLATQWHPRKNGDLTPADIIAGTNKKYWWVCDKGPDHEWETTGSSRVGGGGCPCCSNKKVSITNSLASLYPQVAQQWHPIKNGELTPDQVVYGSHKKVWWQCPRGSDHEWQASVGQRTAKNGRSTGCPFCSNHKVSVTNSLASLSPQLTLEWHPLRNGDLTPDAVVAASTKTVWWQCRKNATHEWESSVGARFIDENKCPFCRSLAVISPQLAAEWHPTKNGLLTPDLILAGSNKKVWWQCSTVPDHEWSAK